MNWRHKTIVGLFAIIISAKSDSTTSEENETNQKQFVKLLNEVYEKEVLMDFSGIVTGLAFNPITRSLYCVVIGDVTDDSYLHVLKSGRKTPELVDMISKALSVAVNATSGEVYIAGATGLYLLDEKLNALSFLCCDSHMIWQLSSSTNSDVLYFTDWPENEIYKVTKYGQKKERFHEIENGIKLTVDSNNNLYYISETRKPYVLLDGYSSPIKYEGLTSRHLGDVFAVDDVGRVIFSSNDRLYELKPDCVVPAKLGDAGFPVSAMVFDDEGNIYFGSGTKVIKFVKVTDAEFS